VRDSFKQLEDAQKGQTQARLGAFDLISNDKQTKVRESLDADVQKAFRTGELDPFKVAQKFPVLFYPLDNRLDTSTLNIEQLSELSGKSQNLVQANDNLREAITKNAEAIDNLKGVIEANRNIMITVPQGTAVSGTGVGADVRYAG